MRALRKMWHKSLKHGNINCEWDRFWFSRCCSFQETLLCGTLSLFGLGLPIKFVVAPTPRGICWLSTGYKFSSTHFFRRESLLALLLVKCSASYAAFKVVHCNVYVLYWCALGTWSPGEPRRKPRRERGKPTEQTRKIDTTNSHEQETTHARSQR